MERADTLERTPGGLPISKPRKGRLLTLPNLLSAVRIALTPVFLLMIFAEGLVWKQAALLVFAVASLTDFDGWIARRQGSVTELGRFLDPLADKILVSSALISFVVLGMVEAWLVVILLVRDFGITGLRIYGIRTGRPVVTSVLAKWKTALQLVLIFGILVFVNVRIIEARLSEQPLVLADSLSHLVLNGLVAGVTLLAVMSGVQYFVDQNRQ